MPGHWSRSENEAIVADYFDMLTKEIAGVSYHVDGYKASRVMELD